MSNIIVNILLKKLEVESANPNKYPNYTKGKEMEN